MIDELFFKIPIYLKGFSTTFTIKKFLIEI